jgi:3-methyl-2-oxobutanoate hydroxymethyltransferase
MRVTIPKLQERARGGEKLVMLTCYDASFAAISDAAGVDILLIGDSLGMVIQGHDSTLPGTLEETQYHVRAVARGSANALVVADMPFGSFQESKEQAFRNAARLMAAGAQMVKLEGGEHVADTVRFLVERGIPVCAHIGLTPQSVHQLGGYRVQGRTEESASRLKADALALEQAGAALLVLELVPARLAAEITSERTSMATIGIGAGPDCDGQVLVLHDMLGLYPRPSPKFSKNFMQGAASPEAAVKAYITAVKSGTFPGPEHSFHAT